jgi:hypothetical protein
VGADAPTWHSLKSSPTITHTSSPPEKDGQGMTASPPSIASGRRGWHWGLHRAPERKKRAPRWGRHGEGKESRERRGVGAKGWPLSPNRGMEFLVDS